ncbi:MAG: NAD(+)/NADH kinase [Alphaproteobacteria bacterium]|nr:NAD(+)/NADH kinase [Alphaproteobacteria bacterium]
MDLFYFFRNKDSTKEKLTAAAARQAAEKMFAGQMTTSLGETRYVLAYGGDGTMLDALREMAEYKKSHPEWVVPTAIGFNYGDVGYLMNKPTPNVNSLIAQATVAVVHPLEVSITDESGKTYSRTAFNDVVVHGDSRNGQSCHIEVLSDGGKSIREIVKGDGVIISTPMGSSAYYRNAGGEPFRIGSELVGVRPICARDSAERIGGLYPASQKIVMNVLNEKKKRPAYANTDNDERIDNVAKVEVVTSQAAYPIAMGYHCPARMKFRG